MRNEFLRIGQIVRAHGVRGDLKLLPLTDETARFHLLREAFLERGGARTPVAIERVLLQPDAVIVHLAGVETREQADALKNGYLCVDRAHAVPLSEGSYFVADLIGCETFDTRGRAYGRVSDVLETGANDVYEIEHGKLLVPALRRVLAEVDVDGARITFDADVLEEVGCFAD